MDFLFIILSCIIYGQDTFPISLFIFCLPDTFIQHILAIAHGVEICADQLC